MGLSIKLKIILLTMSLVLISSLVIGIVVDKYSNFGTEEQRNESLAIIGSTFLFALAIAIVFSLKIIRPVDELIIGTQLVAQGKLDHNIRKRSRDEIGRLVDSFNHMIKRLRRSQQRSSEYSNIASVEKHKAELIIDSMADGVIVTDASHKVVLLNPAAQSLFEIDAEDVLGKHIMNFLKKFKMEDFFKDFPEIQDKRLPDSQPGTKIHEYKLIKPKIVLKATMAPLKNYSNVVIGTVVVLEDVTKLKELDDMKTGFVSTVSHELRTPLTSIKGYASLLAQNRMGPLNEKQQKSINIIDKESDRLTELIDDILDLSKLESSKVKASFEENNIADCIKECYVFKEAKKKGIHVTRIIPKELPRLMLDKTKIIQVLNNLVSNAIKFTKEGGRITVKVNDIKDMIRVDITDTGVGIPKKEIPKLFNKFYQVESHLTRNQGGTGLGLPIVKEIIGLHHGLLSVCSRPKKGTTVSFALPKKQLSGNESIKCWEARDCKKMKCPAYQNQGKRCWLYVGTLCKKGSNEQWLDKIETCRYCDVYKTGLQDETNHTDS